jgi:hypothetical protein
MILIIALQNELPLVLARRDAAKVQAPRPCRRLAKETVEGRCYAPISAMGWFRDALVIASRARKRQLSR